MSAPLYILAWLGTLLDLVAGQRWAGNAAGLALLAFLVLEFPRQRRYAQAVFVALGSIGLAGIAAAPDPVGLFLNAWRRGAQFAGFFLALCVLRDAAETSHLVRRCGQHLVAQPPGRRYAALTAGGHLYGIILSYGAIDLLSAMVVRAGQQAGGDVATRTRRMLLAIQRGFVIMNCWAPLNLMSVVVSAAVPSAPMLLLLPFAFVVAQLMLAVGWAEDRWLHRGADEPSRGAGTEGWRVHLGIVGLVLLVTVAAEAVAALANVRLATGVTLTLPFIGLAWIAIQLRHDHPQDTGRRMLHRLGGFHARIPAFRGEATVLGVSGFAGVALGAAFPASGLASVLAGFPPVLIPLAVPVLLIATGQVGLNPIAVVAVLGAMLPDPAALGVAPATLAFACMLSWGLAVGITPMSASALATARWADVTPWRATTVWNARFTLFNLLLCWAAIIAAHAAFRPA